VDEVFPQAVCSVLRATQLLYLKSHKKKRAENAAFCLSLFFLKKSFYLVTLYSR
jgi:hypothetical protein